MNESANKEIFFNRADVERAEKMCCDNCFEQVVFLLKDKDHEFSMGLTTVLECLEFAIKSGNLPKLPMSWCSDVGSSFDLAFDDDVSYYDEDYYRKRDTNEIFQGTSTQNGGKI